jgi:TonB family protein
VYSLREIARAAGVHPRDVRALADRARIEELGDGFFTPTDAVRAVRYLTGRATPPVAPLFSRPAGLRPRPLVPVALSGTLHAALALALAFLATLGLSKPGAQSATVDRNELRLVFLATPGPGGGGGGGGLKQPAPPPRAERQGTDKLRSPLPARRPPPPREAPKIARVSTPPPPIKAEPLPPVIAPVVAVASDKKDRIGVPEETPHEAETHGPGAGGGTGTGQGTGLGEGDGPGIGPGSGGGTGGGPYRPGSGITPPSIVREVKPDYTDDARRRNIEGDVVLEIVVRSDGSVGEVHLLQGLDAGLDRRAIDAVRQWRFNPARRLGTPVDVMVEVAVEFKLR